MIVDVEINEMKIERFKIVGTPIGCGYHVKFYYSVAL